MSETKQQQKPEPKKVYFNDPQRLVQLIGARVTVVVAGRRTGKTDSIAGPYVLRNMQRMPGSTGGIVVPTFKHGLTNTIPGMLAAWRRWGFLEGIHYVIGKKPPEGFRTPITDPKQWEHVIFFYNGSCAIILSQDLPAAANSLTLSWVLVDEARFVDQEKLDREVLPANGGIRTHFAAHSFNHSILILSDMPSSRRGSWFLSYREKMDSDLIDLIKGTVYKIWELRDKSRRYREQGQPVPSWINDQIKWFDRKLNQLRSQAVLYVEYSSIENLALLGEDYIRQMKRTLNPKIFQTSILCRRLGISKDGFYSSMTEAHKYNASDFDFLNERMAQGDFSDVDCRADADLDRSAPICIGLDYNANINCLVAAQPQGRVLRVLKSFFVKFEAKLARLVDNFCQYYKYHLCKTVVYYFDSTARKSNYAVDEKDFRWWVCHEFSRHGWEVAEVYLGNPMNHEQKHLMINSAFAGKRRLTPLFNAQNNRELLESIQNAGVVDGTTGIHKDKSGEKAPETDENLLEYRTDFSDAFDTVFIGAETSPYDGSIQDEGGIL